MVIAVTGVPVTRGIFDKRSLGAATIPANNVEWLHGSDPDVKRICDLTTLLHLFQLYALSQMVKFVHTVRECVCKALGSGRDSLVVNVMDSWPSCHDSSLVSLKSRRVEGMMHVKSIKRPHVVWCGS
ncbi:hypothetical protein TNCV_3970541 [Trichonephila clavipes]|nr:hypothetical protein TNCV_3970541 [Trichonephila clavipes]